MMRPIFFLLFTGLAGLAPTVAADTDAVRTLADRYVAGIRDNFPTYYAAAGLPDPRRDRLDINSLAALASWRRELGELERLAARIDMSSLGQGTEWLTLAQLRQAIAQHRTAEVCRDEWWSVRTYGWQADLVQIAELQPVGDEAARKAILSRFGSLPAYVDGEIANLREGLRQGYSSPRSVVQNVVTSFDELLADSLMEGPLASPATRDADAAFRLQWAEMLQARVRPALVKYRDFLRDHYLRSARTDSRITANRDGMRCYRARIASASSVDIDPAALFARATLRADQEATLALAAGRKRYGRDFTTLAALADALRDDPQHRFADLTQLRQFIETRIRRGKEASARVVPVVPTVDVEARPYSEAVGDSAPSGEYIPRDEDGRPPIYYYRTDFQNQSPSRLEATVLHESWPGHHLQAEITYARLKTGSHPLAQLVYVPGLGEGWATYVEGLARELGLYESELGVIGSVMDSMTPRLVADLGMHIMGWSEDRTFEYLKQRFPATPPERVRLTVLAIADEPGWMVPYATGAIEIENMREEMRRMLGEKFDLRDFHLRIIEDGTVPFPALRAKLGLESK